MTLVLFYRSDGVDVPIAATIDMVGALLRARTRDANNVEQGTFTATTRPTVEEVQALLDMATAQVAALTGGQIPEAAVAVAEQAIALRTAVLIEASYFPEQLADGASPLAQLQEISTATLQALVDRTIGDQSPGAFGVYSVPVVSSTIASLRYVPPVLP